MSVLPLSFLQIEHVELGMVGLGICKDSRLIWSWGICIS